MVRPGVQHHQNSHPTEALVVHNPSHSICFIKSGMFLQNDATVWSFGGTHFKASWEVGCHRIRQVVALHPCCPMIHSPSRHTISAWVSYQCFGCFGCPFALVALAVHSSLTVIPGTPPVPPFESLGLELVNLSRQQALWCRMLRDSCSTWPDCKKTSSQQRQRKAKDIRSVKLTFWVAGQVTCTHIQEKSSWRYTSPLTLRAHCPLEPLIMAHLHIWATCRLSSCFTWASHNLISV